RVGAENRAQAAGEGEAGPDAHLDLGDPGDLVLDRVLDRRDHSLAVVDRVERRVERRRLAAPRRAAGEHDAGRLVDRTTDRREVVRVQPERRELEPTLLPLED